MSVARFIADQRTSYRVPHTLSCRAVGVSRGPGSTSGRRTEATHGERVAHRRDRRRDTRSTAVAAAFDDGQRAARIAAAACRSARSTAGRCREKTVADSMRRQGLVARRIKRRNGLTRQDKTAPKFPDLVRRDFTAAAPNLQVGRRHDRDPAPRPGKLYLATVIDLYSRRLLGAATGLHPDAELACAAIKMAVAARGGRNAIGADEPRVIFHTDRGSTYTANAFTAVPPAQDPAVDGPGRVVFRQRRRRGVLLQPGMGSPVPQRLRDTRQAQAVVIDWCYGFYNHQRRHSAAEGQSPINYENRASPTRKRHRKPSTISGEPQWLGRAAWWSRARAEIRGGAL